MPRVQAKRSASSLILAAALLAATATASSVHAQAIASRYGCVEVTAQSMNIRSKNSSRRGEILTTVRRGEVLAKRAGVGVGERWVGSSLRELRTDLPPAGPRGPTWV